MFGSSRMNSLMSLSLEMTAKMGSMLTRSFLQQHLHTSEANLRPALKSDLINSTRKTWEGWLSSFTKEKSKLIQNKSKDLRKWLIFCQLWLNKNQRGTQNRKQLQSANWNLWKRNKNSLHTKRFGNKIIYSSFY